MKKIIYLSIGLSIILLVVFKLKSNAAISRSSIYTKDPLQAISVVAETLQVQNTLVEKQYSGSFEPMRESKIGSETQGKIIHLAVDLGQLVHQGDVLVQIDQSLIQLQLQNIDIQIEGLEKEVNRYKILSEADAIQAVQLEKTMLALKSAKIQRATILEQINKCTIRAPFAGIITAKLSEEGAFAAPGVPLLQITDISQLKFTLHVPEKELPHFKPTQRPTISCDAYPEQNLSGQLTYIGSKANLGNHFPVQYTISNFQDMRIKSGMFGRILLPVDSLPQALLIPSSAIRRSHLRPEVYVIEKGKAIKKPIEEGVLIKDRVVITKGLQAGDILITQGFASLEDSTPVFIQSK